MKLGKVIFKIADEDNNLNDAQTLENARKLLRSLLELNFRRRYTFFFTLFDSFDHHFVKIYFLTIHSGTRIVQSLLNKRQQNGNGV